MSIKIIGTRLSTPDQSGYPDKIALLNGGENQMVLWEGTRFGTNPNPTKPETTLRWTACYAQIVAAIYNYECINSPKHGICLALNGLGTCETTLPNMNPDTQYPGQNLAEDVEIHCGFSQTWRGSHACQTVYPDDWEIFISHFQIGDKGLYQLIDETIKTYQ
jgi:hypothetical protein